MDFNLIKASKEYKDVVNNLMQFYIYDFSEYMNCDVENDGLFTTYQGLEDYFKEGNLFAYLIQSDEKHIGFALVKAPKLEEHHFLIAEFFIMKKYRRAGIGMAVATQLFNLHKGQWEVSQRENNKPARNFWNKVINEYTNGEFLERFENGRRIQDFRS